MVKICSSVTACQYGDSSKVMSKRTERDLGIATLERHHGGNAASCALAAD